MEESDCANLYVFSNNYKDSIDILGLYTFDTGCSDDIKNQINNDVSQVKKSLDEILKKLDNQDGKSIYEGIRKAFEQEGVKVPQDWQTEERIKRKLKRIAGDIKNDKTAGLRIVCCPDPNDISNPCNLPVNKNTVSAMDTKRGKIYLCSAALGDVSKYGGYGCILMHELLHRAGNNIWQSDWKKNRKNRELAPAGRAKERVITELAKLLTGKNCRCSEYER